MPCLQVGLSTVHPSLGQPIRPTQVARMSVCWLWAFGPIASTHLTAAVAVGRVKTVGQSFLSDQTVQTLILTLILIRCHGKDVCRRPFDD